jgi:hypothetical protein
MSDWPPEYMNDKVITAIGALSSCAIEGNTLAISLLELRDKDPDAFMRELKKRGWLD